MWEAIWINEVNPPFNELTHHGIKGMKWGVRKNKTSESRTPRTSRTAHKRIHVEESRQFLKARRGKLINQTLFSHGAIAIYGELVAARLLRKYAHIPIKTTVKFTAKVATKVTASKSPAELAGKLAVNAMGDAVSNKAFSTLNSEIDQVNALPPSERSDALRKMFINMP